MAMMKIASLLRIARRRRDLPAPDMRRQIRVMAGLTQAEMAGILGVDRASVARWETTKGAPRNPTLDKYTELLERLQREVLAS